MLVMIGKSLCGIGFILSFLLFGLIAFESWNATAGNGLGLLYGFFISTGLMALFLQPFLKE